MLSAGAAPSRTFRAEGWTVTTGGGTMPDRLRAPGVGGAATQFKGSLPYNPGALRCRESPPPSTAPAGQGAVVPYCTRSTVTYGTYPPSGASGGSGASGR